MRQITSLPFGTVKIEQEVNIATVYCHGCRRHICFSALIVEESEDGSPYPFYIRCSNCANTLINLK